MPSCQNYFGKVFAHLGAAGAIAAASAEYFDVADQLYGDQSVLVQFVINLVLMLGLLYLVYVTKPGGIPKYAAFVGFVFFAGQVIKPYVDRLEAKGTLRNVFLLATGVFLGMMAVGFYDKQNLIGFGGYLAGALIGLILAQFALMGLGTAAEREKGRPILNMVGVGIFAIFTAYDVQVLKEKSKYCKDLKRMGGAPDYPTESLGLFLDFVNLFLRLGRE